ncbi:MAG: SO_0444 family Cu/Zn efflux transporter [Humidesulfovibrio sp.]|nr:SO_0444 family Cu/Zn efflux transporter [Humidesulfovibrio sp.]
MWLAVATGYFWECWIVLREAAPFMLLGFFVAGLLKAGLPDAWMIRHLGGRGPLSVLKAALIGVPLPLCSCGVLPAALGLRRQGAGPGATTAFMIATPETGVDSLAVTYAMIDPLMTVLRPLAALATALVAGLAANLLPARFTPAPKAAQAPACGCSCGGGNCSGNLAASAPTDTKPTPRLGARLRLGLGEAFGGMLADVGGWLLIGILIAGAISSFLPPQMLLGVPGGEFSSMLAMLLLGIPLYVCASSSTPIAASLLLKGLSPGAALVFLLSGPATNATTITAMARTFGSALTGVYVGAIAVCSLGFGFLVNRVYVALGFNIHAVLGQVTEALPPWLETASALLLLALIARALVASRGHAHCTHG